MSASDGALVADGAEVEYQADVLEDAATRLAELLAGFADAEQPRMLDVRAVFLGMGRAAEQIKLSAEHLRRQEWVDVDGGGPEAAATWTRLLASLTAASEVCEEVAHGWI